MYINSRSATTLQEKFNQHPLWISESKLKQKHYITTYCHSITGSAPNANTDYIVRALYGRAVLFQIADGLANPSSGHIVISKISNKQSFEY